MIILLLGWIGVLFLIDPESARLSLGMIYAAATSNHYPPPIAATGAVPTGQDGMMPEPAGTKFTAVLRKTFPLGSDEHAMRAVLMGQGFTAPNAAECEATATALTNPDVVHGCQDPVQHALTYDWGGPACNTTLRVDWVSDKAGRLVDIAGSYRAACL